MVHAWNPSPLGSRGSRDRGQPGMCSEFKASLSEILSQKTTRQRKRPRRQAKGGRDNWTGKVLARNSEHQPRTHMKEL